MRGRIPLAVALAVAFLVLPRVVEADSKKPGAIVGEVVAVCGADNSHALVYVPGKSFVAITGPSGQFEMAPLPPGTYTLRIELPGSPDGEERSVTVLPDRRTDLGTIEVGPDLQTDPAHCGTCNNACLQGQLCLAGQCLTPDCTPGQVRACGTDVGQCQAGTQTCGPDARWGACTGSIGPSARQCDSQDRDCDGTPDYLQPPCQCRNGDTRACGSNVGECRQGAETCVNGALGACTGAIGPSPEVCDGKDNDCDGLVDNGGVCSN